jgi:hypothetical protein
MATKPPDVTRLAHSYRRLVLWFGVQLLLTFASMALNAPYRDVEPPTSVALLSGAVSLGMISTLVALAIYSYRTADALGASVPLLWVVAMVIPCINVITLLALSSRATAACRACGIPVGFLGPKVSSHPGPLFPPERPR